MYVIFETEDTNVQGQRPARSCSYPRRDDMPGDLPAVVPAATRYPNHAADESSSSRLERRNRHFIEPKGAKCTLTQALTALPGAVVEKTS